MDIAFVESFARYTTTYLWRRKLQMALLCLPVMALTWLAFALVPPSYEASALVQVSFQRSYSQADAYANAIARQEEYLNTQVLIISSGDVVRSVIAEIGADKLYPQTGDLASLKSKIVSKADHLIRGMAAIAYPGAYDQYFADALEPISERERLRSQMDYAKAMGALSVRAERKTDLIKISFRHPDPEMAARFVNLIVRKYIDRHIELSSGANGAGFMENEKLKFERELSLASAALKNFSTANDLYAFDAQQTIILDRRKALQLKISDATGGIAEREAEVGELTRQFVLLKLDQRAPQLAALGRESARTAPNSILPRGSGPLPDDVPPLMLVRVYQSTAEYLVKTNADLVGLRELLSQQKTQLADLDRELFNLASKRAEFEILQRNVDLARRSAEAFAVKAIDLKTELSLSQKKLVRLQSVEDAIAPAWPAFPTTAIQLLTGVLLYIAAVAGLALTSFLASKRRLGEGQPELGLLRSATAYRR